MAAAVEFGTSSCIGASVSTIDDEPLGMTTAPSGRFLKIRLTAMMPGQGAQVGAYVARSGLGKRIKVEHVVQSQFSKRGGF